MAFPRSGIVLTAFSFVSLTLFFYVYASFSFVSASIAQQPLVQQEYQEHHGKRVAIIGNHSMNHT